MLLPPQVPSMPLFSNDRYGDCYMHTCFIDLSGVPAGMILFPRAEMVEEHNPYCLTSVCGKTVFVSATTASEGNVTCPDCLRWLQHREIKRIAEGATI